MTASTSATVLRAARGGRVGTTRDLRGIYRVHRLSGVEGGAQREGGGGGTGSAGGGGGATRDAMGWWHGGGGDHGPENRRDSHGPGRSRLGPELVRRLSDSDL